MCTWHHGVMMAGLLLAGGGAGAHGLDLFAQRLGVRVHGQAAYTDGTPARGERVRVLAVADGRELAQAVTGADGRFQVAAPPEQAVTVVVEGDDGHRAQVALPVAAGVSPAMAAPGVDLAAVVRAELMPLREDITRLERRIRLADLLAGVGLIVGLLGAWALWRSRVTRVSPPARGPDAG